MLVVDDNVDGAESLAKVLQICGHEARTAHGGPEALDAARLFQPDLVLLDIGLPGMNGYEVARRLRGDPALAGAVVVALTGWGSEDDKRQSREAGFDFHLTKPVAVTAIQSILARVAADGELSPETIGRGKWPEPETQRSAAAVDSPGQTPYRDD